MTIVFEQSQKEVEKTPQELKSEFITLVNQNQRNYYKMGMILNQLKKVLTDKEFNDFIDKSLPYSYSNLNKYMKIAKEYREGPATKLGVKKAYLLLKINENIRDSFIEEHQAYSKTFDELEDLVSKHNSINNKKRKVNEKTVIKKLSRVTDDVFENMLNIYNDNNEIPSTRKEIMKKLKELKDLLKQVETEEREIQENAEEEFQESRSQQLEKGIYEAYFQEDSSLQLEEDTAKKGYRIFK